MFYIRKLCNVLFKRLQAEFSLASLTKTTMDRAHFGYFFVELFVSGDSDGDEIPNDLHDGIGCEQVVIRQKKPKSRQVIRELIRKAFILHCEYELVRYVGRHSDKALIELQFMVEEYALVLFPPLPPREKLADGDAGKCGESGNYNEQDLIHKFYFGE